MFDPKKKIYVTRAIKEELSVEHQLFIIEYLHKHHHQMNDYLQVFEFYVENDRGHGDRFLVPPYIYIW